MAAASDGHSGIGEDERREVDESAGWLTTERINLYAGAAVFAVVLAFVLTLAIGEGSDSALGRVGGDFPAFYAAGQAAVNGEWETLYDWERQGELQAGLFGEQEGVFLPFAYPPYVAAIYAPLAALPYRAALGLHAFLMTVALWLAVWKVRRVVPVVGRHPFAAFALALAFPAVLRSIGSGQNTTVAMLAIAGVWVALHDRRYVAAGLWAGLLLYKPSIALPVLGLLLLRHPKTSIGSGAMGLLAYGAGVALSGPSWSRDWLQQALRFGQADQVVNGRSSIDLIGFTSAVLSIDTVTEQVIGGVLVLGATVVATWLWIRRPRVSLELRIAVMALAMLIIPVHVQWYAAGLLLFPAATYVNRSKGGIRLGVWALFIWLGVGPWISTRVGFSAVFPAVWAVAGWIAVQIRLEGIDEGSTGRPIGAGAAG